MTMTRRDWPDLLFGAFLVLVAAATLAATAGLGVGTAADMGPGYMPRALALILGAFGAFFAVRGFMRSGERIETVQARPILAVCIAVGAFAFLIEPAGLALASLAAVLIAAFGTRESRPIETLLFGAAVSAGAVFLFVKALALPVAIWPW